MIKREKSIELLNKAVADEKAGQKVVSHIVQTEMEIHVLVNSCHFIGYCFI